MNVPVNNSVAVRFVRSKETDPHSKSSSFLEATSRLQKSPKFLKAFIAIFDC